MSTIHRIQSLDINDINRVLELIQKQILPLIPSPPPPETPPPRQRPK